MPMRFPSRLTGQAWRRGFVGTLLLLAAAVSANAAADEQDQVYRVELQHSTESRGDGSSSSSQGGHAYVERVVALRDDGVEKVFDLPDDASDQQRLLGWQFPVRIRVGPNGTITLLNQEDMIKRRDAWLVAAKIPMSACGSWYFTWDAFKIECDPNSVIETLQHIDIQDRVVVEGGMFTHPAARNAGVLRAQSRSDQRTTYRADMEADPDFFIRQNAENDVVIGQILGNPETFDEAYARRKLENYKGTVAVTLEVRPDGRVWRQVTTIQLDKTDTAGRSEHETRSEVIERQLQVAAAR